MHRVLLANGFLGTDEWLYMKGPVLSQQPSLTTGIEVKQNKNRWKLQLYQGEEQVAVAEISIVKTRKASCGGLKFRKSGTVVALANSFCCKQEIS